MFLQYYQKQLDNKDKINNVRQDNQKTVDLHMGEAIKQEMCDKVMSYFG